MPYITSERRAELDTGAEPSTAGDLAYLLTCQCLRYLEQHEERFSHYAAVQGALESTKLELCLIAGYEEAKILENGDVFTVNEDED